MVKKLAGLGFLMLLLTLPLEAHDKHRSRRHRGGGYIEIHVGTPYGYGAYARGYRSDYRRYRRHRDYYGHGKRYRKFKYKRGRYYDHGRYYRKGRYHKKHRHYHYRGRCPY